MVFKATHNYNQFFDMLPLDWIGDIKPFWESYKHTTTCYMLYENNEPIAGGLVFANCPPDMLYVKNEAAYWFERGYLYLGFIFVLENRRGQNLGSLWLSKLKDLNPNQNYWLTVEDKSLEAFYTKNGFERIKTLNNNGQQEILFNFSTKNNKLIMR